MSESSLSISFSLERSEATLIMEQEPWTGIGIVTKLDLVKALSSVISGIEDDNKIYCGVEGGSYLSGLYIYLFNPSLSYDVGITHGELGEVIRQEVTVRELVKFSLSKEQNAKYPIHTLISKEWGLDTWDSEGGITSHPSISVEGQKVKLSKKVYGTVILEYKTIRDARLLTIPPREDTVENIFDSYAWARWNGGVDLLKLDPPDGAEEDALQGSNCILNKYLKVIPNDPTPYLHPAKPVDYKKLIDYCSQEEIG